MPKSIVPKLSSSPQNIGKALEEIRLLLGLNPEELGASLSLLEKVDSVSLLFTRGNTDIRFTSYRLDSSSKSNISVEFEVKEDDNSFTIKYALPRMLVRLIKKNCLSNNTARGRAIFP